MESMKNQSFISNLVSLCLTILLCRFSSLLFLYDVEKHNYCDVLSAVIIFFGFKYLLLLMLRYIH